jgi:hypothetical protein
MAIPLATKCSAWVAQYLRACLDHLELFANTVQAAVAQDLPAEVLASVLGMHVNTAVDWRTRLHVGYTDYIAARHASLSAKT